MRHIFRSPSPFSHDTHRVGFSSCLPRLDSLAWLWRDVLLLHLNKKTPVFIVCFRATSWEIRLCVGRVVRAQQKLCICRQSCVCNGNGASSESRCAARRRHHLPAQSNGSDIYSPSPAAGMIHRFKSLWITGQLNAVDTLVMTARRWWRWPITSLHLLSCFFSPGSTT